MKAAEVNKFISVFVCDHKYKMIFARQFKSMTKVELFEYLSYFSRGFEMNKDNKTNFESNGVRYIFLPLGEFYLVLVARLEYNIFEGYDILKLLYRIFSEICKEGISSSNIKKYSYEIVLGVDDLISQFGREEININQIKNNIRMDSSAEKEHNEVQKDKESKARDNIVKGIEEIEKLKRENKYVDTSISSEQVNVNQSNMITEIRMSDLFSSTHRTGANHGSMNLRDLLIQRLLIKQEEDMRISKLYVLF